LIVKRVIKINRNKKSPFRGFTFAFILLILVLPEQKLKETKGFTYE